MTDPTTTEGRAELREQIANAEPWPRHVVIEELTREIMCGFLGEKRANEVLRQKNALGAIDNYRRAAQRVLDAGWSHQPAAVNALPALLDALDNVYEQRDLVKDIATWEHNASVARLARARAAEAALDRVRDLLDRHKSQEIYVDDVRAALDGAQ